MTVRFIPTLTGRIVEIHEADMFATDWSLDEAIERVGRIGFEAQEYAEEALLAQRTGHGDPAVFVAGANQRIAMAHALMAAIARFGPSLEASAA